MKYLTTLELFELLLERHEGNSNNLYTMLNNTLTYVEEHYNTIDTKTCKEVVNLAYNQIENDLGPIKKKNVVVCAGGRRATAYLPWGILPKIIANSQACLSEERYCYIRNLPSPSSRSQFNHYALFRDELAYLKRELMDGIDKYLEKLSNTISNDRFVIKIPVNCFHRMAEVLDETELFNRGPSYPHHPNPPLFWAMVFDVIER